MKLDAKPEYFIINGAECEPLLHTDRYIMTHLADRLIAGADAVCRALSVREGYIALKKSYQQEISALQAAIEKAGSCMKIHEMDSFYPAGDEQVIVYEVTGRVVPPAGIPGRWSIWMKICWAWSGCWGMKNDFPWRGCFLQPGRGRDRTEICMCKKRAPRNRPLWMSVRRFSYFEHFYIPVLLNR